MFYSFLRWTANSAYYLIVSALALLLSSASLFAQTSNTPATGVFAAKVETRQFFDTVEALGTLRARENVALTSTVTELVTSVNFSDGQRVKQGDLLLQMDDSEELALMAEEEARVTEAQRSVDRFAPLAKRGAASEAALDESRSQLKAAQARLLALKSRIAQRKILAPFDGVVGLRNISVGSLAQPGTLITTIDDDRLMKLDFSVPEVFLAQIKTGAAIEARTSAFPDQTFSGELASIDSRVDPVTRSIVVRALLNNNEQNLKPGMLMQVQLQRNPRTVLLIQEESVVADGKDNYVFVLEESEGQLLSKRQLVRLGARRAGEVEVLDGLQAEQLIVAHGVQRVRDGQKVKVLAVESAGETLEELIESQARLQ